MSLSAGVPAAKGQASVASMREVAGSRRESLRVGPAIRVLLLSKYDRSGPSSRQRSYQYLPALEQSGVRVDQAPLLTEEYVQRLYQGRTPNPLRLGVALARRLADVARSLAYDVIWLEKELFPFLPSLAERAIALVRRPLVVDYDDATFHSYDAHGNAAIRRLLARKIDRVMQCASTVVVGNRYLAERATAAGASQVEIIPTVIDLERYPKDVAPRDRLCCIGWIGTPRTQVYLAGIAGALAKVCQATGARFVAVGASPGFTLPGVKVEVRPWSLHTEVADLESFDIGVMPLPDEPFARGKCGYKLVQYMGVSLPVVASPVGANCEIVTHGSNGYLAQGTEEWVAALTRLGESKDLRRAMGTAGRARVRSEYCLQVTAPRLARVLRSAAAAPGA